jgi:hypothetical protein
MNIVTLATSDADAFYYNRNPYSCLTVLGHSFRVLRCGNFNLKWGNEKKTWF